MRAPRSTVLAYAAGPVSPHQSYLVTMCTTAALLALMLMLVGCQTSGEYGDEPRSSASGAPDRGGARPAAERTRPTDGAPRQGDRFRHAVAYPTGDREDSAVLLTMEGPRQVRAGQPYTYTLAVTNLLETPIANVLVEPVKSGSDPSAPGRQQPGPDRQATTRPSAEPTTRPSPLWRVGYLAPSQTETRQFSAVADREGTESHCLAVTFEPTLCADIQVVQPELTLTKQAPSEILFCDPLVHEYTVSNTGSGVAQNVTISEDLPEGLMTDDGKTSVTINARDIPAGQSKTLQVKLKPKAPGTYTSRAVAKSRSDEAASREITTVIREPVLEVVVRGPETEYLRELIRYRVTVTNTGDAATEDATVILTSPAQLIGEGVRALGRIAPGESRELEVGVQPFEPGKLTLNALAQARCARAGKGQATTEVRTIPALLLETVDNHDPVKVGESTIYQIVVKNQGSGAARNVSVTAELPPELSFVTAFGATGVKADGNKLTFEPVESLPPGKIAVWSVEAKANKPGMVQFNLRLKSDTLSEAAIEQEPTRLYE